VLPAAGCCGNPAAAYQAWLVSSLMPAMSSGSAPPCHSPAGNRRRTLLLIAAVAHEAIAAAPDLPEVEVRGDVEKGAQVAAARLCAPGIELLAAGDGGDIFEPGAEGHPFEETAEFAQAALQAEYLRALQRPRRAAGLDRQRMRPFAGEQAHHLHEARARRQHLVGRAARGGAKALRRAVVPASTFVFLAREVGHEEQVEVRQVVRQVLHRQGQVGRQAAIGRRRGARGIGQCQGGGRRLGDRADAADARHQHQRIGRQLALQDLLEAAIQRRVHVGRGHPSVVDVERDFEIAFDAVEGADDAPRAHLFVRFTVGARRRWSECAFSRTRCGVADLDRAASAMNQALGMSAGRPSGMPATFGVVSKAWPGSSKPGSVQRMQA
jgi:hypothetical protein